VCATVSAARRADAELNEKWICTKVSDMSEPMNEMRAVNGTSNDPATESAGIALRSWRDSRWLVIVELVVVILLFVADTKHKIPFSKTPFILAVGWISLRIRGLRWRDVGLRLYKNWVTTLGLGIAAGILMELFELFVSQPLLTKIVGKAPDFSDFADLRGNWKLTLIFVALAWTLAAFGEELVYRGYLMNRVAGLVRKSRHAWLISLIVVHAGFGLAHVYQGTTGAIDEGLMGLLLGIIYLRTGRSLAVPIVAHGVSDTIDMLLFFLGKYPGT
jgi:membrane protease YdiL (CAAX protease family)